MHLGKDSAYAAFALVEMATRGAGTPATLTDLAESTEIAAEALSVMLGKLASANIVTSVGGSSERFALSKPPGQITLLAVVEAIEGQTAPDLILPRVAGSTKASASDDPAESGGDPAETSPPAWKDQLDVTAVPTLAAELLGASTIQELVDAQGAPASPAEP